MHIYRFIIIYTILYIQNPYHTSRHLDILDIWGWFNHKDLDLGESGRLEREPLPVHLDKVLKAFGEGLEESEKLKNAGERCLGLGMAKDGMAMAKAFIKSNNLKKET